MIENLNGIHETVKYKENSNVKLFINAEAEDYPNLHCIAAFKRHDNLHGSMPVNGMIWYILMRVILSL